MVGASLLSLVGVIVSGGKRASQVAEPSWAGTAREACQYAQPASATPRNLHARAAGREDRAPRRAPRPVKAAA